MFESFNIENVAILTRLVIPRQHANPTHVYDFGKAFCTMAFLGMIMGKLKIRKSGKSKWQKEAEGKLKQQLRRGQLLLAKANRRVRVIEEIVSGLIE
jgi:hypothetical protein